jgi:hypothetical protein
MVEIAGFFVNPVVCPIWQPGEVVQKCAGLPTGTSSFVTDSPKARIDGNLVGCLKFSCLN